jgi:hypothetical protein
MDFNIQLHEVCLAICTRRHGITISTSAALQYRYCKIATQDIYKTFVAAMEERVLDNDVRFLLQGILSSLTTSALP